jgi:hypothetical protein
MNDEEINRENSWDYWSLCSVLKLELKIEFMWRKNNPTNRTQILKGPIERYIDGKLVSSEQWKHRKPE